MLLISRKRFIMKPIYFVSLLVAVSASPLQDDQHSRCEDNSSVSYTRINITTSPFVNVMNVRIDTPEAIYSTPAVMMIGKTDGEVLRCQVENPHVCETFVNLDSHVYSLFVTGEFLYAGVLSGSIYRCKLHQKSSCTTFQTGQSSIEALSIASGYLYAGLYDGTILKCQQDELDSCQPFHVTGDNIFSLITMNDTIYAGLNNGQLWSCSLGAKKSCLLLYNMTSAITGFAGVVSNLFAVTWDGRLWNCTKKTDEAANFCESSPLNYTPKEMVIFNDVLYTLENEKGIYTCKWPNNTDCSDYGNHTKVLSMVFVYGTYQMQGRYKTEDTVCKWQSKSKCPPVVTYYNSHQRALLSVHVKNGKLYNAFDILVDTSDADEGRSGPAAIFAMGPNGEILLSNLHKKGLLHTSSLFAGNPVSGAGEIVVQNGVIKKISACSDHYQSDLVLNNQVIQSLRSQGYTDPIISQMCGEDKTYEQLNSNELN